MERGNVNWIEVTTVGDLVDRAASETTADAVVFPDERVTYPELAEQSTRFARSLRGLGVEAGDKVAILMPNCMEFVIAFVGAAKLGAVVVPINGRFKAHELGHVISHADVRVLLTASSGDAATDYATLIGEVFPDAAGQDAAHLTLDSAPALRQIVDMAGTTPGFLTRAELMAAGETVDAAEVKRMQERVRVRDVAMLMYTSGTTARPKGCLLSHEAIVRHGANVARSRFFLTPEDRYWDPLPLFHIGGIVPMLSCFNARCTFVHAGHFDADVALAQLQDEQCTVAYPAFETIWLGVLNHPRLADADLSKLRLIQNIATPERLAYMQERMPWVIEVSSYGATECSSNLTLPLPDDSYEARMQTLGHPLPGIELKVVDPETRAERPTGEVGELAFRGYSRFEGYHKDPELTASVIDAEGWFYSGDLARLDPDGRLIYAGRLKDMLKVGGENVSAIEVEDFVSGHGAVDIVQIVGAPDARYDEVAVAYVQLKPGASCSEEEIIAFCVGRIASYKVPRYVRFVTDWPMSGTKIQKFVLREQIAAELEGRGITEAPRIDRRTASAS
ncbi:MAG TPA: AMP-binding protein [Conexibacter sp.]|jgi:fatty-acyl-CoA synthase